MFMGNYRYKIYERIYGEHWKKYALVDGLWLWLFAVFETVYMMLYMTKWLKYVQEYYEVVVALFIIRVIIYFVVRGFAHRMVTKVIKQNEAHESSYDRYSKKNRKVKGNIVICPKIRQQLYDLQKNDILKLNGRKLKVVEVYDKKSDTIKVLECKMTEYSEVIMSEISLKAEEVFEQLGITEEMISLEFYVDRLKTLVKDEKLILPEKNINNVNALFKCYYPFEEDKSKIDVFIENINKNDLILNEDEIVDIFEYFDKKVNLFVYDVCMCYIAIHDYHNLIGTEMMNRDLYEIHSICKKKLPWLKYDTLMSYYYCVWREKGLSSYR